MKLENRSKGEVIELIEAALEWIDALPPDATSSIVMPGFDRDWAEDVLQFLKEMTNQTVIKEGVAITTIAGWQDGYSTDDYWHVALRDTNGFLVDIHYRLKEIAESTDGKLNIQIYSSARVATTGEIMTGVLHTLDGFANIEDTVTEYRYSEMTTSTSYSSELQIGGHDLKKILEDLKNKYIVIVVTTSVPAWLEQKV